MIGQQCLLYTQMFHAAIAVELDFLLLLFIFILVIIKYYAVVALVILNTGPIRKNNRLRTLRSSGFKSKHITSHSNE